MLFSLGLVCFCTDFMRPTANGTTILIWRLTAGLAARSRFFCVYFYVLWCLKELTETDLIKGITIN